jgi:hypothetical protein
MRRWMLFVKDMGRMSRCWCGGLVELMDERCLVKLCGMTDSGRWIKSLPVHSPTQLIFGGSMTMNSGSIMLGRPNLLF